MRRSLYVTAAITVLAAFLLGNNAFGQSCPICVSAEDVTCSGSYLDCGSSTTGCTATSDFTVPCNGYYDLRAYTKSSSGIPCNCSTCVLVIKLPSGTIAGGAESGCSVGNCDNPNDNIYLETIYSYRMYVCLRPCDIDDDCEDCPVRCKAFGALHREVTSCP